MRAIQHERISRDTEPVRPFSLIGSVAAIALAGIGLAIFAGAPRVPSRLPSLEQIGAALSGSTIPLADLVAVLVGCAWLVWGWIVLSLIVELALVGAEAIVGAARWIDALRGVADRLSFPLARRMVAAAFAFQLLSRGATVVGAQPLSLPETALVASADPVAAAAMQDDLAASDTYTVRPGDTLWSIAERAYGSGAAYRSLVQANVGRRMPDGERFTARGVIRPGWDLVVPSPPTLLEEADGERWYTVRVGDTLTSVAATLLGDETRWSELFDLNRGAASPDGGHELQDPNVIWPGLRLRLPVATIQAEHADPAETVQLAVPSLELTVAAMVPTTVPPDPPPVESTESGPASANPPVVQDDAADLAANDTPLLRTPHALYPIALEPADSLSSAGAEYVEVNDQAPLLSNSSSNEFPIGPIAIGGAGLVGAVGVAVGARRIRRLRRLPQEPESEVVVDGGFAEAELAGDVSRGPSADADPLHAIVTRVQQVLDEYNLERVQIVSARHGRSCTTLALTGGLADQAILVDLSSVFAERLDGDVEAWVSADQDVHLRVSRSQKRRLLPAAQEHARAPLGLVPVGVLYDRQVYYAAWKRLGHVLIASLPGHGADTILTSLVATATARRSPESLQVWLVAELRDLPAAIAQLPHVVRSVDPSQPAALDELVHELRSELDRRSLHAPSTDLAVVVSELTSLGDRAIDLELLAGRATVAKLGVSIIAATAQPDAALQSPLQPHFTTRMVLRMQAEETSVGLLGVADAAYLGGGGRLLLRLEEREAVELYGYHVAEEHLERLARVMRSAFPRSSGPRTPGAMEPADGRAESLEACATEDADADTAAPAGEADQLASEAALVLEPLSWDAAPETAPETAPGAELRAVPAGTQSADDRGAVGPPLEVICFDGPMIMCRGRQVWPRRIGSNDGAKDRGAKPWEFLLYVACQPAEGVSVEEAVEALWPAAEDRDAAHAFRQLRYRLRLALANVEGAPTSDGISLNGRVLRLDPAIVRSDAQEFLELVRTARVNSGPAIIPPLERARELFRGDLLTGPDARRYAWLDERDNSGVTLREHFRRLFQQASVRLGEAYAANGQPQAAVDVFCELTDIEPGEERHWRALFRLLAQMKDKLGLLREERRMRAALRDLAAEIGQRGDPAAEEPGRETVQEFQRLLAALRDSEPESAAV